MSNSHQLEEMAVYNDRSFHTLERSLTKSQGRFSLILVRCNYVCLRSQILQVLRDRCKLKIQELTLEPSAQTLYSTILDKFSSQPPDAVIILGLESVVALDELLSATNKVRDQFSSFAFPVVLWVTDAVFKRLARVAPDFRNWASPPIVFSLPNNELMALLRENAEQAFADEPTFSLDAAGLKAVQHDLQNQGEELEPETQASLAFILGLIHARNQQFDEAIHQYQQSLEYWQQTQQIERQCIVLFHIALADYLKGKEYWEETRRYLQECLERFEQANHPELLATQINKWGELLRQIEAWEELQQLAEKALVLHQTQGESSQLAQDYGFLAEVALQNSQWKEANEWAQQALEIFEKISNFQSHHLGLCYFILARSQRQLGQIQNAIENLEKARQVGVDCAVPLHEYDPTLYVGIVEELRTLKFEQGNYLEAFHLKLEQRQIESQYGLRAFIGAGRLQPPRQAINPVAEEAGVRHDVSIEQIVAASGRQKDVEELIERVKRRDRKLTVIYGPSGVGKSSIVQAALVPALQKTYFEGRDFLPVLVQVYKDWVGTLGECLIKVLGYDLAVFSIDSEVSRGINSTPHSSSPLKWTKTSVESAASANSADSPLKRTLAISQGIDSLAGEHANTKPHFNLQIILEQLRHNEQRNLLTVLIFDQFEEFFFDNKDPKSRREFYGFLRQCLEIPYLKVILSLREDYIYYLLEFRRTTKLTNIDKDYDQILYYLGNFSAADAKAVIQSLTARSHSPLEPDLIEQLVEDLAGELGEVRPIELQVVGTQLGTEKITTLKHYQELGSQPQEKLVEQFLECVVKDCGEENERAAQLVLYLLTNENGTRPLKTEEELREDLDTQAKKLNLILEILEGSGLVFRVPGVQDDRYQLVHDYLVPFIRQQRGAELLAELERAKEEQQRTQAELNRILKRRLKEVLAAGVGLAAIAGVAVVFGVQASIDRANAQLEVLRASSEALFASDKKFDALIEALRAGQQLKRTFGVKTDTQIRVVTTLLEAGYGVREGNRLEGHKDVIWGLSFSPDGQMIATSSRDNTIKLWLRDGTLFKSLEGHNDSISSVSFSPDSQMIASASWDKTVKLWKIDGTLLKTLKGHNGYIYSVSFSPDGQIIASASSDKTVRLWRIDGTLFKTLIGHNNQVNKISFSPDGRTIASASEDKTVKLWKIDGTLFKTLTEYSAAVRSVHFSPDGKMLASVSDDSQVKLWSSNGELRKTWQGHDNWIHDLSFSPNSQTIASVGSDNVVKHWSLDGKLLDLFQHVDRVTGVKYSSDGRILASTSFDKSVKLWRLDKKLLQALKEHSADVRSVSFSPDGKTLASTSDDRTVKLWSQDGSLLKTLKGHSDRIDAVSFSPDGKTLASASRDKTVKLWSRDGSLLKTLQGHKDWVLEVSFSPDGKLIASASQDGTIKLWRSDGSLFKTLEGHSGRVNSVSFSPDGQLIASASDDNTVKLWRPDGTLLKTLKGHQYWVLDVSFSSNGQMLASAGYDNKVNIWRRDGTLLKTLKHSDSVAHARFSPDNQMIATTSWDNTVQLWNINGSFIKSLQGHTDRVTSISFSPDGKWLASGSRDDTVILWNLDLDELLVSGCNWVRDYLKTNPNAKSDRKLCDDIPTQK